VVPDRRYHPHSFLSEQEHVRGGDSPLPSFPERSGRLTSDTRHSILSSGPGRSLRRPPRLSPSLYLSPIKRRTTKWIGRLRFQVRSGPLRLTGVAVDGGWPAVCMDADLYREDVARRLRRRARARGQPIEPATNAGWVWGDSAMYSGI
jgi:hypothetical protein